MPPPPFPRNASNHIRRSSEYFATKLNEGECLRNGTLNKTGEGPPSGGKIQEFRFYNQNRSSDLRLVWRNRVNRKWKAECAQFCVEGEEGGCVRKIFSRLMHVLWRLFWTCVTPLINVVAYFAGRMAIIEGWLIQIDFWNDWTA